MRRFGSFGDYQRMLARYRQNRETIRVLNKFDISDASRHKLLDENVRYPSAQAVR